jgi:crossover junction endodeoxyribonuclease RuvC
MNKRIIGIDPGANGAYSVLFEDGKMEVNNLPEAHELVEVINELMNAEPDVKVICYLEKVGGFIAGRANPGSAMFNFGENYGMLKGVMMACGMPFILVTPQAWQKGISGLESGKDNQSARKHALANEAKRRHPTLKITLKNSDAVLIADYGDRMERFK